MSMDNERYFDQLDWELRQAAKPAGQVEAKRVDEQNAQWNYEAKKTRSCMWWAGEIGEKLANTGFHVRQDGRISFGYGTKSEDYSTVHRFVLALTASELNTGGRSDVESCVQSEKTLFAMKSMHKFMLRRPRRGPRSSQ